MKILTFPLGTYPEASLVCYLHEQPMMRGMTRPGAVMCPGGAYVGLTPHEGEQMAMNFFSQGYHAFVVKYSVGLRCAWPQPVVETSIAMRMIRAHAEEWSLNPDRLLVGGFSAGGHVASSLGVYWNDPAIQQLAGCTEEENKPNALFLCYPCINMEMPLVEDGELKLLPVENEKLVGEHTPPTFLVHTYDDTLVPMEQSMQFVAAMSAHNRPVEYHVYTPGGHGALCGAKPMVTQEGRSTPSVSDWLPQLLQWLDELWNPKPATPIPRMGNSSAPRRHEETLGCMICGDGTMTLQAALTLRSPLGAIADIPEAMAVLAEYVPVLRGLKINEVARRFYISTWLEQAGYTCGNPMFGVPPCAEAQTCLERLQAACDGVK